MEYEKVVEYILNIPKFSKKTKLDNIKMLLKEMGDPQKDMKIIHVAGTNGKGSVCNFIKDILIEDKKNIGLFISPHLLKINERISINNINISDKEFVDIFHYIISKINILIDKGGDHPSFFEFIFVMALQWFRDKNLDYVIFEVGMGGRLDATNILCTKISIITKIGLDHTEILGNTIEKIASEKAGIIKEKTTVVYNTKNIIADKVIEDVAKTKDAKTINVSDIKITIFRRNNKGIDFYIDLGYYRYDNIYIKTNALYQIDNLTTAIIACEELLKDRDFTYKEEIYKNVSKKFFWPGRMEKISNNVVIDGAHNKDGIEALCKSIREFYGGNNNKLLFAVADDKNYSDMIEIIITSKLFDEIYITSIENDRALDGNVLSKKFHEKAKSNNIIITINLIDKIEECFSFAKSRTLDNNMLFCTGSLYLVSKIKAMF